MKTINLFLSTPILKHKNKFYVTKPFFFHELSKYFKLNIYAYVRENLPANKYKHVQINTKNITITPFFKNLSFGHFIRNYFVYKTKIKKVKEVKKGELFMVFYPVRTIDNIFCYLLRDVKTIIWVKANPVEYKLSILLKYHFLYTTLKRTLDFIYEQFTKWLFNHKLIFHTGNISLNKSNTKTQFAFISSLLGKKDLHYKKKELTNKIIYVGNLSRQKGVSYLINAMAQLKDKSLLIVGKGSYKKLNANVKHYGPEYRRQKLFEMIRAYDILIMPSLSEKQGKVTLEAMSQGTVVIATDVGGVSAVVKNGYNGLLIKPASSKAIALTVKKLYNNPRLYKKLQAGGYKTARKHTLKNQVKFMTSKINTHFP